MMASFIGAVLPLAAIGFLISLVCAEHSRNKELDRLAERNRNAILGVKYWKD